MDDVAGGDGFDLADLDLGGLHGRVTELVLILPLYPHRLVVKHTRVTAAVWDDWHDLSSGFGIVIGSRHFKLGLIS